MDKPSFMRQGVLRLPPGFRFHPTDEELVVQYLKRKVFSCPLPASIIPEIDLGKYNPWDFPGACKQERYFFHLREAKYRNGNRSNRATGCGYWKATGKDKAIVASSSNQVVGMKKVLVFYHGKPPRGSRTDWIMHEYRLAGAETRACVFPQRKNSTLFPSLMKDADTKLRVSKKVPWFLQKIGCSVVFLRRKELPRWMLMSKNATKRAKVEMVALGSLISWGCNREINGLPQPLHQNQAVSPSLLMDQAVEMQLAAATVDHFHKEESLELFCFAVSKLKASYFSSLFFPP